MSETQTTDDSDGYDLEDHEQIAEFTNEHPTYVIRSLGEGGFDEVTRPDSRSADEAAEVHERATGNATETQVRF
jgi:hypothetical protein